MDRNCLVSRNIGVILGDGPGRSRGRGRRELLAGHGWVRSVDIPITSSLCRSSELDIDHHRRGDIHRQFLTVQAPIHLLTPKSTSHSHSDTADVSDRPSFLLDSSSNRPSQNRYPQCTHRPRTSLASTIRPGIHQILMIAGRRRSQTTALPSMDNGHVRTDSQGRAGEEGDEGILGLVSK
jgi:hypothetical protein